MNLIPPADLGLLTIAEVAARLDCHPVTILNYIRDGRLRAVPVPTARGNRVTYLFRAGDVRRFKRPPWGRQREQGEKLEIDS